MNLTFQEVKEVKNKMGSVPGNEEGTENAAAGVRIAI